MFSFALLAAGVYCTAAVRLPKVFGDSMVLQRDRAIPIWGWADPNEKITVQLHSQSKTTAANAQGM